MKKLFRWAKARLTEKSTYVGAVAVAASLGLPGVAAAVGVAGKIAAIVIGSGLITASTSADPAKVEG